MADLMRTGVKTLLQQHNHQVNKINLLGLINHSFIRPYVLIGCTGSLRIYCSQTIYVFNPWARFISIEDSSTNIQVSCRYNHLWELRYISLY